MTRRRPPLRFAIACAVSASLLALPTSARAAACPLPTTFMSVDQIGKNLSGCNLSSAGLFGDFSQADFSGADLSGSTFFNNDLSNANFTGANLSGAKLAGVTLDGTNFTNANLTATKIGSVPANGARTIPMGGTILTGANISNVVWAGIRGRNLVGQPATLDARLRIVAGILIGPAMDLSGTDLSTRSLTSMNLSQALLTDANLTAANLTSVNLSNADLTRANLTNARLGFSNLREAKLASTNVTAAHFAVSDMTGVQSSGIVGTPSDMPAAWRITLGRVLGPGIDMKEENLAGADLRGFRLNGFDLTGTNLTGANLDGATLTGTKLAGVTLDDVHAFGARFVLADLTGASIRGGLLRDSNLQQAKLHGANFDGSNLVGVDFRNSFMNGPNVAFDCTPFRPLGPGQQAGGNCSPRSIPLAQRPAVLRNTRLNGARFQSVNLRRVDLSGSDLQGANFTDANLTRAKLSDSRVDRTVFTGATLFRARATGMRGTTDFLPILTILKSGKIIGPGLDLSNLDLRFLRSTLRATIPVVGLQSTNLRRANVTNLPLSRYSLRGAITVNVTGNPENMPAGWRKRGGTMLGPGVDLSFSEDNLSPSLQGVNTRDISLQGARLRNLFIPGSRLEKPSIASSTGGGATTLRGADLTGSIIDFGITPDFFFQGRTDLRDARLVNVRVTSNGGDGDICNADLRGADLTGITMDHLLDSDISGARLNGSILSGSRLSGTPQSLLSGHFMRRGYLVGPGHDLGGADLSGLDLHGRNLSGVKLKFKIAKTTHCGQPEFDAERPTNLSGANLSGADLSGLDVDGSSMFGPGRGRALALDARNTNFNGADLRNAVLVAPFGFEGLDTFTAHTDGSTFRGVDARGADMHLSGRVDLTDADLRGADVGIQGSFLLHQVTLTGAIFDGQSRLTDLGTRGQGDVVSSRITGTPAQLPQGWRLSNGRLVKD